MTKLQMLLFINGLGPKGHVLGKKCTDLELTTYAKIDMNHGLKWKNIKF